MSCTVSVSWRFYPASSRSRGAHRRAVRSEAETELPGLAKPDRLRFHRSHRDIDPGQFRCARALPSGGPDPPRDSLRGESAFRLEPPIVYVRQRRLRRRILRHSTPCRFTARLRARAIRRGFVSTSTNTGHDNVAEPLGSFAQDRQRLLDYAFRSLHTTAETATRIATAYYGVKPSRAYFEGCSTGRRQALILAQRFPDDFDGIIVGAPVLNWTGTMMRYTCTSQALAVAPIPYAKMALLSDKIYDKCDAADGLKDGLIDDPRRCDFRPSRDLPKCAEGGENSACFTAAQIGTLEKIYGDVMSRGWA